MEGSENRVHEETRQIMETRDLILDFNSAKLVILHNKSLAINELVDVIAFLFLLDVFDGECAVE